MVKPDSKWNFFWFVQGGRRVFQKSFWKSLPFLLRLYLPKENAALSWKIEQGTAMTRAKGRKRGPHRAARRVRFALAAVTRACAAFAAARAPLILPQPATQPLQHASSTS